MWYFSWILGLAFALAFGVLNAMWYEVTDSSPEPQREQRRPSPGSGSDPLPPF